MKRRSFLSSGPQVVLAAACAFGAGRLSTSGPAAAPPCVSGRDGGDGGDGGGGGDGGDGGGGSRPPDPPNPPATPGPGAAPRLVPPLPTPTEDERSWLEEWLDLVARPTEKAGSGC